MPHIISQTQEDDIYASEYDITSKEKTRNEETPINEIFGASEGCKSLVMVRSHYRKAPRTKKIFHSNGRKREKRKTMTKLTRVARSMDIASFKEIMRVQKLENEEFKAAQSPRNQATVDEWNGFWSMAATMEKKKKRRPLTVMQSKEKKLKKYGRSHHVDKKT